MSVLMSSSQGMQVGKALRNARPGLVRVGVEHGELYVQEKPDGGEWVDTLRLGTESRRAEHPSTKNPHRDVYYYQLPAIRNRVVRFARANGWQVSWPDEGSPLFTRARG